MTRTDLFRKALEKLKIVSANEDVEPEEQALISDKYDALYDMLRGLNLVSWAQAEDVPDFAVIPLTNMLAHVSAGEYGQDPNIYAAEGALGLPQPSLAERQLRTQVARDYVSEPARSEYF